ncbi:S-s bond formation pathway protein [White-tailed deer poxvirus]|nr:S-s bond formation pathway protein [White-tailed deer poxvirus]
MEENQVKINTLYNLFVDRYLQNLSLYSVPVNTTCGIHVGEIRGVFNRCKLRIINRCLNNPKLSFVILVKTFKDIVNTLPQKEREELADEIGIDLKNDDVSYVSELERRCNASADVNNIINVETFDVGNCSAPEDKYILLQIINSGTAEANCGLNAVMNALNKRYVPDPTIYNSLPFSKPWFIIGSVIICFIFILGICSIKRKISYKYKYSPYLYV